MATGRIPRVILCTVQALSATLYFGNKNPGHRFLSFAELAAIVASSQHQRYVPVPHKYHTRELLLNGSCWA